MIFQKPITLSKPQVFWIISDRKNAPPLEWRERKRGERVKRGEIFPKSLLLNVK
jgi:hypothetical protein